MGAARPLRGRAAELLVSTQILTPEDLKPEILVELTNYETEIFGRGALNEWTFPVFARNGRVYIMRDDIGIAASAELMRCWTKPNEAYILSISVRKSLRCRGLGSKLTKKIISDLREEGFKAISLTLDPKNLTAAKFYERFGFKHKETLFEEYGVGEDRYSMRLVLANNAD